VVVKPAAEQSEVNSIPPEHILLVHMVADWVGCKVKGSVELDMATAHFVHMANAIPGDRKCFAGRAHSNTHC
jgi:hypothetical protein